MNPAAAVPPSPVSETTGPDDPLAGEVLTLDALTTGVSVYQRAKGHRFSSDDTVTAWVAMQVRPRPVHVLDLGCGLGSVLLHVAWSAPQATLTGVEAQAISYALAQRNVAHNGLQERVRLVHGDLRDPARIAELAGPFDLITGTPPYFPPETASDALDHQRAFARIEYRGGVEAYLGAAAQLLTDDGWFVMCGDADAADRVGAAAGDLGLSICRHVVVLPRAERPPLFAVWALRRRPAAGPLEELQLTLRDAAGDRTGDARMLRAFSGFAERSGNAV